MYGIREKNYIWDDLAHQGDRPSYQQFLEAESWADIPRKYRQNLRERSEYDPVYHKSLLQRLKHAFPGVIKIKTNFSQSWQDFFVLTMLNGRREGYFLELGASDPLYYNNTFLLELEFGWRGVSIEKRHELKDQWQSHRLCCDFIVDNCLHLNFPKLLTEFQAPPVIDYLQVDLAQDDSYQALIRLPHDKYRFRVITFETDIFSGYTADRDRSRAFMQDHGYELLIDNVAVKNYPTNTWEPFEDWYVDTNLVDAELVDRFRCVDGKTKLPHEIFLMPE